MVSRRLRYLGASTPDAPVLLHEGQPLEVDAIIELVRTRSPWNAYRPQERVILGSHPARADVLLEAEGIHPEHVRFYLPRDGSGPDDLKVIVDGTVDVNDRSVLHSEWYALEPNDELLLGAWRFRFERDPPAERES